MRGKILAVLAVFSAVVFLSVSAKGAEVISRGQIKGWFLDPGRTMSVYYYPDGRPAMACWKQNWYQWAQSNPLVVVNVSVYSSQTRQWYYMYSASAGLYYSGLPLLISDRRVVYRIDFRCYRAPAVAYLKIY